MLTNSFLTEEFAWRNIRFSDRDWRKLMDAGVAQRWKATPRTWLFLRIILAVIFDMMIVFSLVVEASKPQRDCNAPLKDISSLSKEQLVSTPRKELYAELPGTNLFPFWFFYLTNWGLMVQAVYLHLAALATLFYFVPRYQSGQEQSSARQPVLVTLAWVFRTIALPVSFAICVAYWTLVFPSTMKTDTESPEKFICMLLVHGGNVLIQAADFPLSYEPFLFVGSFCVLEVFNVVYLCVSLIHFASGITNGMCDKYLYAFVDWGSPAVPIMLFFGFGILVVPFLCGLCTLATKCVRPQAQRDMLFE